MKKMKPVRIVLYGDACFFRPLGEDTHIQQNLHSYLNHG